MPKLPSVENTSVALQRTPAPQVNVSVTPEQLAGSEVRLLTELGKKADAVTAFVIQRQNAKDLDVVTRAENAIKEVEMERILAANQRTGVTADGLLKEEEAFFDSGFNPLDGQPTTEANQRYLQIYNGADERQQAAIDMLRQKRRLVHLKTIGLHEERETTAAALKSYEASITTDVARALINPEDEDARMLSMESIDSHARSIGALNNEDPLVTQERIAKAYSSIHRGTIDRFLADKQYLRAEEYFKEHKKEIRGSTSEMQSKIARRRSDVEGDQLGKQAKEIWNTDPHKAYKFIEDIENPETQATARAQLDFSIKEEQAGNAEILYRANQKMSKAIFAATEDGQWVVRNFSDLPNDALQVIVEQPDAATRIQNIKESLSNRSTPVEPPKSAQASTIVRLYGLAKGTREERLEFLKEDINALPLDTEHKILFGKLQEDIRNPSDPSGSSKDNYFRETIRMSNFDKTDDGHNEVQAALTSEVLRRAAEASKGNKTRAPGNVSFDEYKEIVDDVFSPGKVAKMKSANSRPAPSTTKIPVVGTPKAQAKAAAPFIESIGTEKKYIAAFEQNVEAYAQSIASSNKSGQKALHDEIERYIEFAKTNKGWLPDVGVFGGDRLGILAQVPRSQQNEVYWEFDDGVKVTYGQTEGVGLSQKDALALKQRIRSYLAENRLPAILENKAKAYREISAGDKTLQMKQELLTGSINGQSKRAIYSTLTRMSPAELKGLNEDSKKREKLKDLFTDEVFPILDLVIREKR